jgi:hypothetical protein
MQVTIHVPDALVSAAKLHGKPLAEYIEEFLITHAEQFTEHVSPKSVANAIDRIHQLRQNLGNQRGKNS